MYKLLKYKNDKQGNVPVLIVTAGFVFLAFVALVTAIGNSVGTGGNLTGGAKSLFLLVPLLAVVFGILIFLRFTKE